MSFALPEATIAPPAENYGIVLGQPINVGAGLAGLLVTNTTDQAMSFTIKIEYRKGHTVGEMTGTVSDLLPRQSRVAQANAYRLVPSDPDDVVVSVTDVTTVSPPTPTSETTKNVTVSEPRVVDGSSGVVVEVTNKDARLVSV